MKKQSASKSFAILGTANIIVKILAIIYIPFQTYIMGNDGNAIVAKGMAIYTFLFSLSNAGLPNAISKLVAEQTTHKNFKAAAKILKCSYTVLLGLGIAVGLFMLFGAKVLANSWLVDDSATYLMLIVLSPALIFTSVSCALRGYFQGRQNMMPVAISNVLEQLLNSFFTVVFAWILIKKGKDYGAAGTAVGTLIAAVGAAVFLCYIFFVVFGKQRKNEIHHTSHELPQLSTKRIYKEITRYSLPAILNTVAVCAAGIIDNSATSRLQKAGYTLKAARDLFGVYSYQYNRLFTLAIAFSTALVSSMIPAISEAIALKNHRLVKHRVNESYKAIYLVTIPSIMGLTFLAQPIISLVFVNHDSGAGLVTLGVWTAILMTIQSVQTGVLIAAGRPTEPSVNLIIGMAVKILLNYQLIAIPSININGAIIGSAVGWGIAIILNQIAIKRRFNFKTYYIRMMIKPAFASVVMGTVCFGFYKVLYFILKLLINPKRLSDSKIAVVPSDLAVLPAIAVGACIYFAVMVMIKGIKKNDILRLPFGTKIYGIVSKVGFLRSRLEA